LRGMLPCKKVSRTMDGEADRWLTPSQHTVASSTWSTEDWRKHARCPTTAPTLTSSRGYTTAHAIKIFHKFFPSPQTANVRFMVRICLIESKLDLN
jgi:hypothetical protein